MAAMRAADASGQGRLRNFETVFKTKKGEKIPVAISASITYDDEGHEIGSIGFAKDIREIRRRDQLVTLGEIAIGLSHEMNNSLEVLVNQIEMLRQFVGRVASDEDYLVESDRLDSFGVSGEKNSGYHQPHQRDGRRGRVRHQREYLHGKMMTDLHVENGAKPCDRPKPDERHPLSGLSGADRRRRCRRVPVAQGFTRGRGLLRGDRRIRATRVGMAAAPVLRSRIERRRDAGHDGYELYQAVKRDNAGAAGGFDDCIQLRQGSYHQAELPRGLTRRDL